MTRKIVAGVLALTTLTALQIPPASGRVRPREVVTRYVAPTPGFTALCVEGRPGFGCVRVTPRKGERFVYVEIADASGTPTQGFVNQDWNGDGSSDTDGLICGRTEEPIRVKPEVPIHIYVIAHLSDCPESYGTTGTVTAVFGKNASEAAPLP